MYFFFTKQVLNTGFWCEYSALQYGFATNVYSRLLFTNELINKIGPWYQYCIICIIQSIIYMKTIWIIHFSCHFDAIKGTDLYVYYLTMLTFVVVAVNSALYVATWIKIYKDSKALADVLGESAQSIKSIHNAAKNMSLFVAVFFVQWFSLAAYSITALLGNVPEVVLYLAIFFNNFGGVLNGIVFIIIKRRKRNKALRKSDLSESVATISSKI